MAQEVDIKAEALGKPPKDLEPQAHRLGHQWKHKWGLQGRPGPTHSQWPWEALQDPYGAPGGRVPSSSGGRALLTADMQRLKLLLCPQFPYRGHG